MPVTTLAPTALVTGHLGFIGRHMMRELTQRGYLAYGMDIGNRRDTYSGDVRAIGRNRQFPPLDLVVHCAYRVGGRAGIDGDRSALAHNLAVDVAMFMWARAAEPKKFLYFSSSAAYPVCLQTRDHQFPLTENEARTDLNVDELPYYSSPTPDADYGFAKLAGERLAENYRADGGTVTVVRPFSGYGEDQDDAYPFPSITRRAFRGDLSVWGPRGQTRDWIHVDDVVNGALAVVASGTTDPVNLCTGIGTTMGELAQMAAHHAGPSDNRGDLEVTYDESKPTGVYYRVGDPTRFHSIYQPRISIDEGVMRMVEHIRTTEYVTGEQL